MKSLLFLIFFLISSIAFNQTASTTPPILQTDSISIQNHIYLRNISNDIKTKNIDEWSEVTIWIKDSLSPIKGHLSYNNDSTLILNEKDISIQSIEKIRISPAVGEIIGVGLTGVGTVIASFGITLMLDSMGKTDLTNALLLGFGYATTIVGGVATAIGTFVLIVNNRHYHLDEWEFEFRPT